MLELVNTPAHTNTNRIFFSLVKKAMYKEWNILYRRLIFTGPTKYQLHKNFSKFPFEIE